MKNKGDALLLTASGIMLIAAILLFSFGFISLGTSLERDKPWGTAGGFLALTGGICGLLAALLIKEQKDYPYALFGVSMSIVGAFFLGETFTGVVEVTTFFIFGFPIMVLSFIALMIVIKKKEVFM